MHDTDYTFICFVLYEENFMRKRGRCDKCGEWLEKLTLYNGMMLDDKCLIDEKDKELTEQKVQNLETYKRLVQGTVGVSDDIETA